MKNILLITVLMCFAITSCKPELTQSIKFEIECSHLRGEVEIAGQKFAINDSIELKIIESRLKAYGIAHEIVPRDVEYQYELRLPKEADLEAIKRILTTKGELGFWEMYESEKMSNLFSIDSLTAYTAYFAHSIITVPVKDTVAMSAILRRRIEQKNLPYDLRVKWVLKPNYNDSTIISLYLLRGKGVSKGAAMSGDCIVKIKAEPSNWNDTWLVDMQMNKEGAQRWAKLTGDNLGKCLGMVIDDKVYSAPMVHSKIEGGRSSITGDFSEQEAKEMAAILGGGTLLGDIRIKILEEKKSSPEK